MKFLLALTIICALLSSSMAKNAELKTTLTNLVNMQTRAVDAIDSALELLRSLKQANNDAQAKHDEINRTNEATHGAMIADLTAIADANKATGDEATAHRKHIEEEIQVTQEYLVWINNRRDEINARRESLREHRCYANMMFIKALKEHDEALEVIRWLREDILGIIEDRSDDAVDFTQIKDSASKLSAYAHLFTQNQLKEFAALQSKGDNSPQAVDAETAEWDNRADDNEQKKLELNRMTAGTDDRDVGQKLLDAVDRLEQHLIESIAHLEKSEIQAAWDLSQWLQDSEAELVHLDEEQATKTTYIDKLLIAIIGAKAREDKAWEIYFESAASLNDAIDVLNSLRAFYAQEKARRDEENQLLDEVIVMFINQVQSIDKNMRTKVNDHADDGIFQDSDIARSVDSIGARDGGSLAANVAAESRN